MAGDEKKHIIQNTILYRRREREELYVYLIYFSGGLRFMKKQALLILIMALLCRVFASCGGRQTGGSGSQAIVVNNQLIGRADELTLPLKSPFNPIPGTGSVPPTVA
jgi:hypothetical protein